MEKFNIYAEEEIKNVGLSWLLGGNSKKQEAYRFELKPAELDEKFNKKYNVDKYSDLCNLYIDGVKVSDTLYRYGGMTNIETLNSKRYVQLLKYTPAKFTSEELKRNKRYDIYKGLKYHLKCSHAIIKTENGIEMMDFGESIHIPYIIKNSNIVVYEKTYYFIPTGEQITDKCYGNTIETDKHIIIEHGEHEAILIDNMTGEKSIIK